MDRWLRQAWLPLVALFLATVAYLQARGVNALVAASLHDRPAVRATQPSLAMTAEPRPTAEAILERNPFDSVTGPLDGSGAAQVPAPVEPPASLSSDPRQDPTCDFADVTLTVVLREPARSFASVIQKGDSKLVPVGGSVGDHTLSRISSDRAWLRKGSERCQMQLFDEVRVGRRKAPVKRARRNTRLMRNALPKSIADKIDKVSATEYNVQRSVIDEVLAQQAKLMRAVRFRPQRDGAEVVGMRVLRVPGGSLLAAVGIRSGDVIRSINGFSVTDPQRALEAYGKLRAAKEVNVDVVRGNKPVTIRLNIR
jgi:general secretion pathway protein C